MEIPYTVSARPRHRPVERQGRHLVVSRIGSDALRRLFSAYIFLRLDAAPGDWPHGLLNVPVGTMNTAILIASSVTVVLAWAALKMRDLTRYRIYMAITILCGVVFLVVKLAYEWPQKFDHFGAFIKEGALEKYEPYLGNKHLLEEGLPPRKEITGHLHNKEALKDPNIKEYEIALDPVYADPTNPQDGSAPFLADAGRPTKSRRLKKAM